MDILIRQTDEYKRLFNCSFYKVEDIPLEARKSPISGAIMITLFIIFEMMYVPCIYSLCQKEIRQHFCYKLILMMSIYDMTILGLIALFPGYLVINGYAFCSMPITSYVLGCFMFSFWCGYAMVSGILAFNRCLLYTNYSGIFNGKKEFLWLLLPPTITVIMFFYGRPGFYSVTLHGNFFNCHVDLYPDPKHLYPPIIHAIINFSYSVIVPGIYVVYFWHNHKLAQNRPEGMSNVEYSLFFQIFGINLTIVSSAFLCAIMQFVDIPKSIVSYTHLSWLLVEGMPPFIFLGLNHSIQRIVLNKFFSRKINFFRLKKWSAKQNSVGPAETQENVNP